MQNLYDTLKNKRKQLGLSLRDAAKLIGISHSYLSTLEKGVDPRTGAPIRPTPETLQLISNAYNIQYSKLMEMAGYLPGTHNQLNGESKNNTQSNKTSKLTRRDEREIEKILEETRKKLENAEGLMFFGEPASPEAIQSILDSMRIGMEIAKQRNKEKYTPKKYKKNKDKDHT